MMDQHDQIVHSVPRFATLPIYRANWQALMPDVEIARLEQLPVLGKSGLRNSIASNWDCAALAAAVHAGQVEFNQTSGTSGERIEIVRPRDWWEGEHRHTYAAIAELADFDFTRDKRGVLSTAICSNTVCHKNNRELSDRSNGYSIFHNYHPDPGGWSQADIERIRGEIAQANLYFLDADPYYLATYLQKTVEYGIGDPLPGIDLISLDYEKVLKGQMRYFVRSLPGVRFVNLYGSTELGCLYYQTGASFSRVRHDSHVELRAFDTARNLYELIVSSVKNPFMPFIRYETGDLVRIETGPAGEAGDGPRVAEIMGRRKDVSALRPDRHITSGEIDNAIFACAPEVINYRLNVEMADLIVLHYVSASGNAMPAASQARLHDQLTDLYGASFIFSAEQVARIAPRDSGKYLTVLQQWDLP
jgi:phenylacetate-CoA ligase